jgi:hypothetical protein
VSVCGCLTGFKVAVLDSVGALRLGKVLMLDVLDRIRSK